MGTVTMNKINDTWEIEGQINTQADYDIIRENFDTDLLTNKSSRLKISIKDSYVCTSSVMAYLLKIQKKDGIEIELDIHTDELIRLFERMPSIKEFKINQV